MTEPRRETFFLPGPTEMHPDVAAAMTRPMIGHRGAQFRELFASVQSGLRTFFSTERTVAVVPASSTGLMEMGVRGAPPGRILALTNGGFSRRFADVAAACGRDVDRLDVPWGRAHDLDDVRRALVATRYSVVTFVHCETSTGVLSDIRALAALAREHGATALVDVVSSVGGAAVEPDAWDLDFVFAGSQKTLAIPPGLAFAVATDAFVEGARANAGRGAYLDVVSYVTEARANNTPSTPAVSLFFALEAQIARIAAEGMPARLARHAAMARATHQWVAAGGNVGVELGVLAPEGHRSPTVTVITLPDDIPSADVLHAMKTRGFTIGAGYGPLSAGSVRIGHMGEHTVAGVEACLAALGDALVAVRARREAMRA